MLKLVVPTAGGGMTIATAATSTGACAAGCGQPAGLELTPAGADTVPLCGDCVARALALYLGRRHLDAGGDISDLRRTDGPTHE